ncbi:MAG: ABC transporter substrate-binding protein [Eubacterium sp.]|nr:ABC transporter substrate-binding protein [Eubacterium sp.]
MKKLLAFVLAAVLALGCLAGCGGAGSSGSAEGDAFYIGGIGPTTGGAAIYGNGVKNGAQIAIDEINEAGGINGYKIEYNFQDDTHDAEKSVNAYNTLKDWGMQILLGTVTSTPCTAVAAETANDNIFEITPSASSPDVLQGDESNVFQVCFSDPNQGAKSAEYIATNKLAKKVAVIYDSSDVYSSGIEATFEAQAKDLGFDIVSKSAFTADSKTDFNTQLKQAQDKGAELVFLPIYYQEASIILTQANDMGYKPVFFGVDGMDGILTVENFDTKLAEGVMLLTPFAADSEDEAVQSFVKKYQDAYGEIPNQFAADAYDGVYAIKAAIEKAGVTPDMDASEMCDALKKAMTEITVPGITGGEEGLQWNAKGEVNKEPKAVIIKDGAYVSMD